MSAHPNDPAAAERRRAAARKAGLARAQQFTSQYQAAVRSHVSHESLVASGRAGNRACIAKHGAAVNARRLSNWRRTRPTRLMLTVMEWLDQEWVSYTANDFELVPGKAYADILFRRPDGRLVDIECDGAHWHERNAHHGEDRPAIDRERDALVCAAGFEILRLSEAEILSGAGRERMLRFLFPNPGGG